MFMRMELHQFIDAFEGRNGWDDTYTGHFSVAGLITLFDHIQAAEIKSDEQLRFSRAKLSSQYTEHLTWTDYVEHIQSRNSWYQKHSIEQTKNKQNVIHIPYDPEKQTGFIAKHF